MERFLKTLLLPFPTKLFVNVSYSCHKSVKFNILANENFKPLFLPHLRIFQTQLFPNISCDSHHKSFPVGILKLEIYILFKTIEIFINMGPLQEGKNHNAIPPTAMIYQLKLLNVPCDIPHQSCHLGF